MASKYDGHIRQYRTLAIIDGDAVFEWDNNLRMVTNYIVSNGYNANESMGAIYHVIFARGIQFFMDEIAAKNNSGDSYVK